jgi:hypothetical protein
VAGWFWLLLAIGRALKLNYRNGDPSLLLINRFLLAYFWAKTVLFFFVFGNFYSDLAGFAGLVGLSIALNGGIRKRPSAPDAAPKPAPQVVRFRPRPALGLGR